MPKYLTDLEGTNFVPLILILSSYVFLSCKRGLFGCLKIISSVLLQFTDIFYLLLANCIDYVGLNLGVFLFVLENHLCLENLCHQRSDELYYV